MLVFLFFLEFNILLPILINILEKINAGLVFAIPLFLSLLPLFGVLLSDKFIDHSFVCLFVSLLLGCKLLKFNSLVAMGHSFLVFNLLYGTLSLDSSLKQLQVTLLFRKVGLFSQAFFLLVVFHKFQITLAIQNLALTFKLPLFLLIQSPLSLKHVSLGSKQILFVGSVHFSCLLLPLKNGKGIRRYFFLLKRLLNFALSFFLCVKLIQLSVNLLFHHLLLDVASFVN